MIENRKFMFNRRSRWPAFLASALSQSAAWTAAFFDLPAISANRSDRLNMAQPLACYAGNIELKPVSFRSLIIPKHTLLERPLYARNSKPAKVI